jgi:hypothetical protein
VLWRTPRPLSPWAAPLQKRSILRSSPRLSEFEPSVAPAETLPVLDAAAEPGADSPVDLSLPDLSFLDADVLLLRWWKRHHSLKSMLCSKSCQRWMRCPLWTSALPLSLHKKHQRWRASLKGAALGL